MPIQLGCSLKEAFGESWNSGPQYFQAPPERFRVMDPYSTNTKPQKETFNQPQPRADFARIKALEAKVEELTQQTISKGNTENFALFGTLSDAMCDPDVSERMDNLVRFALIAILAANVLDLLSNT
ncbi:MAG: hypothetical protein CMM25_08650 [Rhodospirillaceae bacterium]|nr:hypothetical protein [Rhodospirillaceae bacterium]|tara:strand:+ start:232 stop:609 length:378 start_codon:yes stop_codon:yes gene_type:complete